MIGLSVHSSLSLIVCPRLFVNATQQRHLRHANTAAFASMQGLSFVVGERGASRIFSIDHGMIVVSV